MSEGKSSHGTASTSSIWQSANTRRQRLGDDATETERGQVMTTFYSGLVLGWLGCLLWVCLIYLITHADIIREDYRRFKVEAQAKAS